MLLKKPLKKLSTVALKNDVIREIKVHKSKAVRFDLNPTSLVQYACTLVVRLTG